MYLDITRRDVLNSCNQAYKLRSTHTGVSESGSENHRVDLIARIPTCRQLGVGRFYIAARDDELKVVNVGTDEPSEERNRLPRFAPGLALNFVQDWGQRLFAAQFK